MPESQSTNVTDREPVNLQVLGIARSQALAVAYQSLAQSLSLSMQNSVAAQQSAAAIKTAIVSLVAKRLTGDLAGAQPVSEDHDA